MKILSGHQTKVSENRAHLLSYDLKLGGPDILCVY